MSKKSTLALAVCLSIMATPTLAETAIETATASLKRQEDIAQRTFNALLQAQNGLKNFYTANSGAWPSNLSDISTHYSGDFTSPLGTIQGRQTTTGYELFINTNNLNEQLRSQLSSILAKNRGGLNGDQAVISVDAPQSAAILQSALSRFSDPSGTGELNTMYTDLLMNSKNISNVGELSATNVVSDSGTIGSLTSTTIQSNSANISQATIQTATIQSGDINTATIDTATIQTLTGVNVTATNLNASNGSIDNLTSMVVTTNDLNATNANINTAAITSTLTVDGATNLRNTLTVSGDVLVGSNLYANGTQVIDSAGRVYYQGQDLDLRFLGIGDTAANANNLGGVDASLFARRDTANTFLQPTTFNNGITVNGSGVNTTNLDASGNVYTNNMYVKARNTWITTTIDKANSAYSRVAALETKVNSGATTGTWKLMALYNGYGSCVNYSSGRVILHSTDSLAGLVCDKGSGVEYGFLRSFGTENHPRCSSGYYACR